MDIIQSAPKQKNSDVSLQTKKIKISNRDLGEITYFMWTGRKQAQTTYESGLFSLKVCSLHLKKRKPKLMKSLFSFLEVIICKLNKSICTKYFSTSTDCVKPENFSHWHYKWLVKYFLNWNVLQFRKLNACKVKILPETVKYNFQSALADFVSIERKSYWNLYH